MPCNEPCRRRSRRTRSKHLFLASTVIGRRRKMIKTFKISSAAAAAIGVIILAPALMGVGHAYAAENSVRNRVLITTAIVTADTPVVSLPSEPTTPVFTSTNVRCPFNHCTMRVEVSSQFENIHPPDTVGAVLTVDDSDLGVLPSAELVLDTTSTTTIATFSWMKENLNSGNRKVDVYLISNKAANAGNRILTIELYN
jgi:hypothetical protein